MRLLPSSHPVFSWQAFELLFSYGPVPRRSEVGQWSPGCHCLGRKGELGAWLPPEAASHSGVLVSIVQAEERVHRGAILVGVGASDILRLQLKLAIGSVGQARREDAV
jgi:hypothetical protein